MDLQVAQSGSKPVVRDTTFVHKDAVLIGRVQLSEYSSVWPGAVLRAGKGVIRVGEGSNIQDRVLMHSPNEESETIVGRYTSIGKGAILDSCHIGDHCIIGDGAVILEDAVIGDNSVIGDGALVTRYSLIPPGSLVFGHPAKVHGSIDSHAQDRIRKTAQRYVRLAKKYN
ncbi:MAG: gamma carbonic anhydrase family protein [Nanoarchaeota archaeon]